MKKLFVILMVLGLLLVPSMVLAATTSSDDEVVSIPKNMLTDQQKTAIQQQEIQNKIQQYGNWVGMGKEIGIAVDSSLAAITQRASEFANTKLGGVVLFLVVYKVIG